MPRTLLEPDPRWTSDPYRLRAQAEEYHHETLRKIFALPPKLSLPKQTSTSEREEQFSRVLSFRRYDSNQFTARRLSELAPDDAKIFCWKDCAVYGLHTGIKGQVGSINTYRLLERGYRAWFPRRSTDRDVSDGNFWGIPVWFQLHEGKTKEILGDDEEGRNNGAKAEESGALAQIWSFHEMFYDHLKGLTAGIEEGKVDKWEMRASSTEAVMIIELDWEEQGVRLTWKENPAERYVGFAAEELRIVEQKAQGGFWELRCPLERAVRIVASRDFERRGGRREEWNHQFEETLVDGDDV
ncbi:MAG: hypothetical protein Q9192_003589 [Flavoplaca navasiana]